MPAPQTSSQAVRAPVAVPAVFYPPHWRIIAGALDVISRTSLLALLALLLFSEGPVNPLRLIRLTLAWSLLPGLAAALLRIGFVGLARVEPDTLVLERGGSRVEIPARSISAVEPWLLPVPGGGLWLRLKSGKRWSETLQICNPRLLIEALAGAGASTEVGRAAAHWAVVYACARSVAPRPSLARILLKFPVFALIPTLPLFRVHQLISYGGVFGEYYQYGLEAYLLGFAIYWATLTIYLLLYAAALRALAETVAVSAAIVAPTGAARVRTFVERACAWLYYGGVPVLVILRFLPW